MKRVTSSAVAQFFANGKAAKNSNGQFYTPDGKTLYSYGPHFVVARRLNSGIVVVNKDKESRTTSKHTGYARRALTAPFREIADLTAKLKRIDAGLMRESDLLASE